MKNKKIILLLGGIFLIFVIIIIIVLLIIQNEKNTLKIAESLSVNYNSIKIENLECLEEYNCKNKTEIYIEEISDIPSIIVSEFTTNYEALNYEKILKEYSKQLNEKIQNSIIQKSNYYEDIIDFTRYNYIVNGRYLILLNENVKTNNDINEIMEKYNVKDKKEIDKKLVDKYYETKLNDLLNDYEKYYLEFYNSIQNKISTNYDKIENCINDDCENFISNITKYEGFKEFQEDIEKAKEKYNEIIENKKILAKNIDSSINELETTLNIEEYNKIKDQIEELNDSFYDEYKTEWNNKLNSLDTKIYKKSAKKYNYKDLLRNPDNYIGETAYFFGEILQKVSNTQYRIGVDCKKYTYISGYSCENTIYMFYYGSESLIEDDMIKIWGDMSSTITYETIMGASVTIPSIYAKYIEIQ